MSFPIGPRMWCNQSPLWPKFLARPLIHPGPSRFCSRQDRDCRLNWWPTILTDSAELSVLWGGDNEISRTKHSVAPLCERDSDSRGRHSGTARDSVSSPRIRLGSGRLFLLPRGCADARYRSRPSLGCALLYTGWVREARPVESVHSHHSVLKPDSPRPACVKPSRAVLGGLSRSFLTPKTSRLSSTVAV
jgi:hypothetical protein